MSIKNLISVKKTKEEKFKSGEKFIWHDHPAVWHYVSLSERNLVISDKDLRIYVTKITNKGFSFSYYIFGHKIAGNVKFTSISFSV